MPRPAPIGRAACGDPWLFRNLIAELTGAPLVEPTLKERRALLERHYDLIVDLFGEAHGTRIMRKYTFFYCSGLRGVRRFRGRFVQIESRADFAAIVAEFFAEQESARLTPR
jgi:tRNA-dihydrouridine synthase B